jgi:choline transporter-like protein 2/4/5
MCLKPFLLKTLDIICLLLFIAFLGCWGAIGAWSYTQGDPLKLIYPSNSDGEICGKTKHE